MSYPVTSAEDLKWRARSDARTLAEAEEIKADRQRMALAQKEAKSMVEERQSELKNMSKVAGKQIAPTSNTKNRSVRRQSFEPYGGFPTTPTM